MILQYACCFCGKDVTPQDKSAIAITLRNLWGGEAAQGLQCHSDCAMKAFPTDTAMVDPESLRD